DGHNLFFYPWLKSAGDKFIEHGHRLAGALIGFVSIGLAVVAWKCESRQGVRAACYAVLLAVIFQGLLGGARVRMDARIMAMIHGSFAALVFALMACVAVATSRSWIDAYKDREILAEEKQNVSPALTLLSGVVCVTILLQYLLGGLVRHLGWALHEHLAGAVLVFVMVTTTTIVAHRSSVSPIRRAGWLMFGFLVFQVLLGLGAWVMKFGFAPTGYVAVINSTSHIVLRTAHTVSGMLLLSSAVILRLKAYRWASLQRDVSVSPNKMNPPLTARPLTWEGGLR
ncbi:MAG: COX15/CtaA family protein, partial [Planctomycetaceae bacterium]|nr:COX15/CtaA family protein [Planctomycetaceae bacterium]